MFINFSLELSITLKSKISYFCTKSKLVKGSDRCDSLTILIRLSYYMLARHFKLLYSDEGSQIFIKSTFSCFLVLICKKKRKVGLVSDVRRIILPVSAGGVHYGQDDEEALFVRQNRSVFREINRDFLCYRKLFTTN